MRDRNYDLLRLLDVEGTRLHTLLYRLTLREDVAEDLLQELFLRLAQSSGFGRAEDQVAYAVKSAMHLAFDWRRAQKRQSVSKDISSQMPQQNQSPLDELGKREEFRRVLDALTQLPELQREVVVHHYLEHQSYNVIARILGKTAHQVRALSHKAIVRLRDIFHSGSHNSSTCLEFGQCDSRASNGSLPFLKRSSREGGIVES